MFTLIIKTENAAFGDHFAERDGEVADILRKAADALEGNDCESIAGDLRDVNGNKVGRWSFALDLGDLSEAAGSFVSDLESGLADGTYDDETPLAAASAAVDAADALLKGL